MRAAILFVVCLGCGNSSSGPKDAPVADAPAADSAGLDASCFTNPQTHYEIINACTSAEKVYKPGRPSLQNADGTLPPLP